MKKTSIFIVIILSIFCNSGIVSAQVKTTYLPSLETLTKGKPLNEGLNLIYTSENGSKVFANKVTGKETEYLFKKSDGSPIPPISTITTEKGQRRCWKCIPAGNDVDCFLVPCPTIIVTGPGKTL